MKLTNGPALAVGCSLLTAAVAAIDYPQVNLQELKDKEVSTISKTARLSQLQFLGFGQPKNVSEWIDFYNAQQNQPMDVQAIALNSPATVFQLLYSFGNFSQSIAAFAHCRCNRHHHGDSDRADRRLFFSVAPL